jgi:hypothetical protein
MTLHTLDDVRKLMRHLPEDRRQMSTWRHVAAELDKAAAADLASVVTAPHGADAGTHRMPAALAASEAAFTLKN